jgi:nitroreductase
MEMTAAVPLRTRARTVTEALESRRAVKAFDPQHQLSDAEIEQLLALAMLSPTAWNIQNWRFVVVRDPAARQRLRTVAFDQPQVTEASLLIVLCADLKAWDKQPGRYWRHAPQPVQDFVLPAIRQYYAGRAQVERDEAMRSCGIAAMALMLAAQEMGYASCPMDGFDFDAVGRLINLPPDHVVAMFVAIGRGLRDPWPRSGQLSAAEVVVADRFPG